MANVLPLPQIPPGPAKRSGKGAPSDLDSLFEAMDLNRDGFLDAGGEHPSKNCLAQSGGAMGDWAVPPDFTQAEKKSAWTDCNSMDLRMQDARISLAATCTRKMSSLPKILLSEAFHWDDIASTSSTGRLATAVQFSTFHAAKKPCLLWRFIWSQ